MIAIGVFVEIELPFLLKHQWKPRVIAPIDLDDGGVLWPLPRVTEP
jgi:hypothetical protein